MYCAPRFRELGSMHLALQCSAARVGISVMLRYIARTFSTARTIATNSPEPWLKELLLGEGFSQPQFGLRDYPVAWGDMDYMRHVNNVEYLRFFETARINCFNSWEQQFLGTQKFMSGTGVGPIMRSVELFWRYPMRYPDTISVVYRVGKVEEDRFHLHGVVVSHQARKVASRINEILVTVDYDAGGTKKAPVPFEWREIFKQLD